MKADGASFVGLADKDGNDRLRLRAAPDGTASLGFPDEDRSDRIAMATKPEGSAALTFFNKAGKERLGLGVNPVHHAGGLRLSDQNGILRAVLSLTPDGPGLLAIFGEDGKVLFQGPPASPKPEP